MKINKNNLTQCLNELLMSLNKGERIRVQFEKGIYDRYIQKQMKGMFEDLLCTTDDYGNKYLGRIR